MNFSRRQILIAGLGLAATGCATTGGSSSGKSAGRIGPIWPEGVKAPTKTTDPAPRYQPVRPNPATSRTGVADAPVDGVLPRKNWTRHGIARRNINAMNGVKKITIHHEGWTPVTFTSATAAYDRIENIRQIHVRDRGWADIGYHYIIDRAGRVIEGRPIQYQGAHVSENNPHNLGILVLGNFEKQKPSNAQVQMLGKFTKQMMTAHNVPASQVRTHREINPTQCPGRTLQAHIDQLRRSRVIA
ncbi:MAG: peptidoglycan recognition family protein [Planctomycetota bacterium]